MNRHKRKRGNDLPQARLNPELVRKIRDYRTGTAAQWARQLGVHVRTIEKARQFGSWVHVL